MASVAQHYNLTGESFLNTTTDFIVGVECEIESIYTVNRGSWQKKEDHSLRNDGWEFVSPPLLKEDAIEEFITLHDNIQYHNPQEAFSERTSIHVHVNCHGVGLKETRNIILLYALFEELFFSLCKPSRRANIHCTPLTETHLPARYAKPLPNLVECWSKYTALNILPLSSYGTIEFRHMHGHNDITLFRDWLDCLENLWRFGQNVQISSKTLGDSHTVNAWREEIFKNSRVSYPIDNISNSLIDLKLAV